MLCGLPEKCVCTEKKHVSCFLLFCTNSNTGALFRQVRMSLDTHIARYGLQTDKWYSLETRRHSMGALHCQSDTPSHMPATSLRQFTYDKIATRVVLFCGVRAVSK